MEPRKNLVLFTGDSPHKLREELLKWTDLFASKYGTGNDVRIDPERFPSEMVRTELLSPPFFVEKRLVIFEGIPAEAKKKAAAKPSDQKESSDDEGESPSGTPEAKGPVEKIEAAILEVLDSIPDSTIAIFVCERPNPKSELLSRLLETATVKRFGSWDRTSAAKYAKDRLPKLDSSGLTALLSRTGYGSGYEKKPAVGDDRKLADAVERLSLAFGEMPIGVPAVESALPETAGAEVFKIAEALAQFDPVRTAELLRAAARTESVRMAFAVVVGEIRKSLYVQALRNAGKTDADISAALGLSSWQLGQRPSMGEVRHARLLRLYESLVRFDAASKTGLAPGADDLDMVENGLFAAIAESDRT